MRSMLRGWVATVVCFMAAFVAAQELRKADASATVPAALAERLPVGGFRDVTWADPCPGRWQTLDVTSRGVSPGEADVTKALQAVLDGLDAPTILHFPAGTYRFSMISVRKGNVILKGAGPERTIFRPLNDGTVFELLGKGGWYEWPKLSKEWQPRPVTADVPAGAVVVPVADTAGLKPDDAVLVVENLERFSYADAKRGRGGVFVLTKVEPQRVTLNLPLAIGLEKVAER
ncbi:MAG: glycosyl hydrolase family 28-related protein, partial [Planctomycetota bacterium]